MSWSKIKVYGAVRVCSRTMKESGSRPAILHHPKSQGPTVDAALLDLSRTTSRMRTALSNSTERFFEVRKGTGKIHLVKRHVYRHLPTSYQPSLPLAYLETLLKLSFLILDHLRYFPLQVYTSHQSQIFLQRWVPTSHEKRPRLGRVSVLIRSVKIVGLL